MVNPQELKEKIVKELKEKEIIYCETLKELDWSYFNEEEKREIGKVIFDNIKENLEGWEIKKIRLINSNFGGQNYKKDELGVVHQSAKLEYDDEGFLINDYRVINHKSEFTDSEWKNLEKLLKQEVEKQGDNEAKVENHFSKWFPFGSSSRGNKS